MGRWGSGTYGLMGPEFLLGVIGNIRSSGDGDPA